MTQCNHGAMKFSSCRRRRVRVDFSGGSILSNAGALLLRELVIDFDATDDPVHGHQPGRFFHGYYDRYCVLWPPAPGRVPSPVEHRCSAAHVGDIVAAGQAASPSVAGGAHRAAGGLGVLPAPDARLVRAPSGGVHRGAGPQWGTRTQGRGGVRGGRAWLPGDREEVPGVHRSAVWRGCLAPTPAGHRPHRARTQGAEPALHRDQPRRSGEGPLRAGVLPARRDGEPYQGAAALPTAPRARGGGRINTGWRSRPWPTPCSRRCAAPHCGARPLPERNAEPCDYGF